MPHQFGNPSQIGNPSFGNPAHVRSEALPWRARAIDLIAIYGAFGLIAAIVFGTAFYRAF